ncbi:MAG TPA: hypothetical protein VEG32_13120 [Clostridia bacterium]|nr:hypothetical protein [Clostridia bacterium]
MAVRPATRLSLRDIHQEIDLYDRKIAHLNNYEPFDSESAKKTALDRLISKRETLVKAATEMVANGIEFDPKYLPRSFRTEPAPASEQPVPAPPAAAPAKPRTQFGLDVNEAEAQQRKANMERNA